MDYRIDRLHHTSPVLKILQDQGHKIPVENLKRQVVEKFGHEKDQPGQDASKSPLSETYLDKIIEDANALIFGNDTHFQFKVHEKTGDVLIKLIDNETNEVIKEIPPEKLVEIMANLWDLVGILVDKKA